MEESYSLLRIYDCAFGTIIICVEITRFVICFAGFVRQNGAKNCGDVQDENRL